nr:Mfa1 family fimbria major subunit [Prevotella sp.]
MKKMNLLAMSLVSAAALSFSSCSSNDDLTSGGGSNQAKVESFYMTFAVQTPTSNGTRTQQQTDKEPATAVETKITSGTFYLVDQKTKETVFTKHITASELNNATPESPATGTTKSKIEVPVQDVKEGVTYIVYFLANTSNETPWTSIFAPAADKFTAINKFDAGYATDNAFVMFNQNDKNSHADKYTVEFKAANKEIKNPATVSETIKLDRVTARIDKPTTVEGITITAKYPEGASDEKKAAIDAEIAKVKTVTQSNYAITNLSNKTNIMQKWDEKWAALEIPTDIAYMQKSGDLGDQWTLNNYNWFANAAKNYVFENTKETATTMYFEYVLGLDETKFTDTPDFTDGTFYRYNGVIYRSIKAIYDAYADQPILFGGKTKEQLLGELKMKTEGEGTAVKKTIGATEADLAKFRKDNVIEVFVAGKTYYSQVITDKWLGTNTIQRNTVYKLKVKNIYNLGADVPNGKPDENKPMYYLNVEVSVNPWVLSTQDVNLGE